MKKVLWEQFGIESPVPVKPFPGKAIFPFCAENGNAFDVARTIPVESVTVPLLVAVLFVAAFAFSKQSSHRTPDHFLSFSNSEKVPIYLKLGRLIYYS